ncbi:hypothetical protein [Pseudomonas sp. KB_12]|jgi:hypothetical protein|uniref:hypothetical protein n=1 Tax=Pseudomonas sp. KB_12 TaxID=3233034 RepID=UPI003F9E677B
MQIEMPDIEVVWITPSCRTCELYAYVAKAGLRNILWAVGVASISFFGDGN